MEIENKNKTNNPKGANKEFPLTGIGVAEEVLLTIDKAGGKIDTQALSSSLRVKGGAFARKLSTVKRWGLATGSGTLSITEIGKSILHPISDEELSQMRKTAFLKIPLFAELYTRFKLNLPDDKTFIAILIREYNLKEVDAKTILNIYKNSIKKFLSSAGEETIPQEESPQQEKNQRNKQEEIISNEKGVSILIHSPMGNNKFQVKEKKDFKQLRKDLEKMWDVIETFWSEEND